MAKLKEVARESLRIRPQLSKSMNLVLARTLANIRALNKSLTEIDKAIQDALKGFVLTLQTIAGMGPIDSAGIKASIGDISRFSY